MSKEYNKEYLDYLKSDKWKELKRKIMIKRGFKCEMCLGTGIELHGHHLTYIRFGNELESDIQILCKICHKHIHKLKDRRIRKKKKRTLAQKVVLNKKQKKLNAKKLYKKSIFALNQPL